MYGFAFPDWRTWDSITVQGLTQYRIPQNITSIMKGGAKVGPWPWTQQMTYIPQHPEVAGLIVMEQLLAATAKTPAWRWYRARMGHHPSKPSVHPKSMTIVCAVFLIGKIHGSGNPEVKVEWPSLPSISVIHFWNVCLLFPQSSARLEVLVL